MSSKVLVGSIYPIEDGKRFRGVLSLRDEFGLPFRKTFTGTDQKKLRKKLDQFLQTYEAGKPSDRMTVDQVCNRAIELCEEMERGPKTIKGYRDLLRLHISPVIGAVPICALKPSHVERMIQKMETGVQTKKLCRDFLRMAINRVAIKAGYVGANAAALADLPKIRHQERNRMAPEQLKRVLDAESNPVRRALWSFLAGTGLRPGEARTLLWADFTKKDDGYWLQLRRSKTAAGLQPVPISSAIMAELDKLPKKSLYVFPSESGEPFKERMMLHFWKRNLERAKVPYTNLYQLRKLFGTLQARKVNDVVLKSLMRHTDVRTTKQFYTSALDADLREAVEQ